MLKPILFSITLFLGVISYGQVGINTENPKATLDVEAKRNDSTKPDGIIVPRLTGVELQAKNAIYTANQKGALVYVENASPQAGIPGDKTAKVTQEGFYYFSGSTWQAVKSPASKIMYMPAVIFDTSTPGTYTRDLYEEYKKQFQGNTVYITGENGGIAIGSPAQQIQYTGGIISSDALKPVIEVYSSDELTYYITYYDQTAFAPGITIDSDGKLTYTVQNTAPVYAYMNIVFVVNE